MHKRNYLSKILLAAALPLVLLACKDDLAGVSLSQNGQAIGDVSKQSTSVSVKTDADTAYDYTAREAELLASGWTKAFESHFNSNQLNLSKWNVWTGGSFNDELQYYQGNNLQVTGGNLIISAKRESVTGPTYPVDSTPKDFEFTSARIETKELFSAHAKTPKVRMVARIKLPKGYGMWPAFWSYGDPWPTQGEIDILEARGQNPYEFQTNYFYGKVADKNLVENQEGFITADEDLQEGFHVYEMVWEKTKLTFYLDGKLIETKSGDYVSNLFGKKEKIILNLAVGGKFFVDLDPARIQTATDTDDTYGTMYVDWVKVFTSK